MKTAHDPRHERRVKTVQELFAYSFHSKQRVSPLTQAILDAHQILDTHIQTAAPEWPLEKIAKIDLAILRLAVYELVTDVKEPQKVVIDEAVELAKTFGGDKSSSFINGVLGNIVTMIQK